MKLISWNVNGLRACCDKGFRDAFTRLNADFFCLQETKMQAGQLDLALVLELCREERLFGHRHLYPPPAPERKLRHGHRRARP